VYKQVFPFYSRDQFEREIARLGRQLEVAQQRIAAHLQEEAAAKARADDQMRKLQHRLMQKAQSVRFRCTASFPSTSTHTEITSVRRKWRR
jgi:hypothetical protein